MNYVKKMCILRQIKQGFSGDGKPLSGLIKIEQYGKNLAVEVSIINFAPLSVGEYYCLLSDGRGKTEMLSLRGKSIFNILSDVDVSAGFCGIVCYVKGEVTPIAYGVNGNGSYDWRAILRKAMPPVFPKGQQKEDTAATYAPTVTYDEEFTEENEPTMYEMNAKIPLKKTLLDPKDIPVAEVVVPEENLSPSTTETEGALYDDEAVATKNYFEEKEHERIEPAQANQNARTQSPTQTQGAQTGADPTPHDDATGVLDGFAKNADGYYLSIKREWEDLCAQYPRDKTLEGAFSNSSWVRIRGTAKSPQYLVGALSEESKVRYICYALAAEDKENPPEEIKGVCTFVPISPLVGAEGFFVLFQSAATGECVKPPRA